MKRITMFVKTILLLTATFISTISFANNGWDVSKDGSFSLKYNDIELSDFYPAFDGISIKPLSVKVEKGKNGATLSYQLEKGKVVVTLATEGDMYKVSSKLVGLDKIPGQFQPMATGKVKGADRFYKQGYGFAGPSGVFPIPGVKERMEQLTLKEDVWSYDGYLFFGFIAPNDNALVFSAFDNKNYMHRSTMYNRQNRFGLIDRHVGDNNIYFQSGFATEEVKPNGNELVLPDIYISKGEKAYETFRLQATRIAEFNNVKLPSKPAYHFCTWYEFHRHFSHEILSNMINGIKKEKVKPEFQTIQIDAGYAVHGDWLDADPEVFPNGLEAAIKEITQNGYKAGIWVGPFMAMKRSKLVKNHPDWILKDLDGNPVIGWERPHETMYVLDASHPEVLDYFRKVFSGFRKMGITSFKTDFMDWGIQDSRKVKRHTPGKTSVQYFDEVLKLIREEIGEESYWMACISPFQSMVGYANAVRTSNDVHPKWIKTSTINMFQEMRADQFFNNVLFHNDPDVLYLRNYKTDLSENEAYSIALYDGILGGVINTSCRYNTVEEEYKKLWKFLKPTEKFHTAKIPNWSNPSETLIAVREYDNSKDKAVLFVNISGETIDSTYVLNEICGIEKATVYEWKPQHSEKVGEGETVTINLKSHESVLYYISTDGKAPSPGSTLHKLK